MKDILLTTLSKNGNIIGYYTNLKNCAKIIQSRHSLTIISTSILCRALTAAALLSGNLKNRPDILTLTWDCSGHVKKMIAEINFDGKIRGYIQEPNLQFIEGSIVDGNIKTEPYIGFGEIVVERKSFDARPEYYTPVVIETGEIAQDISLYLDQCLKIQSALKLGISISNKNIINVCGGILLMALSKANEFELAEIYQAFNSMTSLTEILKNDISKVYKIFNDLKLDLVNVKEINFKCSCNSDNIKSLLKKLPHEKLKEYIVNENKIEAECQFCTEKYIFDLNEFN